MSKVYQLFVCTSHKPRVFGGGCCSDKGSENLVSELEKLIAAYKLEGKVVVSASSCLKNCLNGPSMMVIPGRICYGKVGLKDLERIVKSHFVEGKPVRDLIRVPTSSLLG
ncbi:MAG: (2Fe-2S) ferredoxin domain-containing protein [Bacteroidota bacterium]